MPWNKDNLPPAAKNVPDKWKSLWVDVANDALKSCQNRGGKDCKASAIKQALAVVARRTKESVNRRGYKKKTKEVNLTEDILWGSFSESNVREKDNYITNVAVLAPESKNRRRYSENAMRQMPNFVEGIPCYANHPDPEKLNQPRDVRELIGRFYQARTEDGKTYADLEVLENQKLWVFPIAKQMPEQAGMSINAVGKIYRDKDGTEIVESLTKLFSVDLVSEPATTKSFFEQQEKTMDYESLDIENLKENRPDIIQDIKEEINAENSNMELTDKLNEEIKELKGKLDETQTSLDSKDKEFKEFKEAAEKEKDELEKENDVLKTEKKVREQAEIREKLINTKIEESKLDKELISDKFLEQLRKAEDEKEIEELIEDRKGLSPTNSKPQSKEKEEGNADSEKNFNENVENVFGLPKKEDK